MGGPFDAFFMPAEPGRAGQRFCIFHPAAGAARSAPRGLVVFVHAFAEEMNKSRRMAALQSRALANAGHAVLQIDLHGCGDSSGDFGDASWSDWIADVRQAARWMRQRHDAPLWLWGHRAGALLAAQAATGIDGPCNFLFWQAATSGQAVLHQFLRLKLAGQMRKGGAKGAMDALKRQIAAGESVEVAGYRISAALAQGLERATMELAVDATLVHWLDLAALPGATPSPATLASAQRLRDAGHEVHCTAVQGPAFWQTTEIEEAPALLAATLAALKVREAEVA